MLKGACTKRYTLFVSRRLQVRIPFKYAREDFCNLEGRNLSTESLYHYACLLIWVHLRGGVEKNAPAVCQDKNATPLPLYLPLQFEETVLMQGFHQNVIDYFCLQLLPWLLRDFRQWSPGSVLYDTWGPGKDLNVLYHTALYCRQGMACVE